MPGGLGLEPKLQVARFEYDFAKDGGAIGTLNLRGGYIPKDALVIGALLYVEAAVTSTGAPTVQLMLNDADDILAATLKAALALNAVVACVPVFSAATVKRMTADRNMVMTIGTEVLSAGKFHVLVYYQVFRP